MTCPKCGNEDVMTMGTQLPYGNAEAVRDLAEKYGVRPPFSLNLVTGEFEREATP